MSAVMNVNSGMNVYSTMYGADNNAKKQQIDFLHMLMVQLKNQNPSEPYDNQQFAAQLATFSQLEQLTDIKELLNDQADVMALLSMSMENTALPSMIGKYASAASNILDSDGINPSEISYKVTLPVVSGNAMVYDSSGKLIKTIELSNAQLRTGDNSIEWDGKNEAGDRMLPGKYTVKVELSESNGQTYNPETFTVGKIEAIRFKTTGTVIVINGNEVSLGAINDVRETPY